MKKIAVALVALAAVIGFVGCTNPTNSTPTTTLSNWQIKGSQDNWTLHQLTVDPLVSTKLTYTMSTPYKTTYQFVLVGVTSAGAQGADPANKFDLAVPTGTTSTIISANNGTAFSLAPTATGNQNVYFHADYSTYTVTVDISNPSAPSVKLVAGTTAAAAVTSAVLGQNLQIKGNQFSKIDGNTVAAWTATNPQTANLNTTTGVVSWDVYVDNKTGSFGINSNIDGWIAGSSTANTIDVSSLTSSSSTATTAMALFNANTTNLSLTNIPYANATYTITLTPTAPSVLYGAGSYSISVALKTASTTNWAFTAWTNAYLVGSNAEFGSWTPASSIAMTDASGVFTKQITASATGNEQFQIIPTQAGWTGQVGWSAMVAGTGNVTLSDGGGNIQFAATSGQTYTITVDMTTAAFTSNGTPTVSVSTP